MHIVDPHIHLWNLETGLYPHFATPSDGFIGNNAPIARTYDLEEFVDEGAGIFEVIGAVHVEAFPTDPVAEVAHIDDVAKRAPFPLGAVGFLDLSASKAEAQIENMRAFSVFKGIRQVLNRHQDPLYNYVANDYMDDPNWQKGFALLEKNDLSFDLQLYPAQASQAAQLAKKHQNTNFALNHAAMWVDRNADGFRTWKGALKDLASQDNVHCKISGLGMLDRGWTIESIRPLVYEAIEAFGVKRAMFASNFPVDKLFGSYVAQWRAFDVITKDFTQDERHALFVSNAQKFYRL